MAKRNTKARVTVAVPNWDMGAMGAAKRANLQMEDVAYLDPITGKAVNPNGVKRMRRFDMLEKYYRDQWISVRGFTAGEKLRDAWEQTQRGPGWPDNDRVQSSAKPDHAIAIQTDRASKLIWVSAKVPKAHAVIVEHVVMHNGSISGVKVNGVRIYPGARLAIGRAALRLALDAMADALGC